MPNSLRLSIQQSPRDRRGIYERTARSRFAQLRRASGLSQLAWSLRIGCSRSSVEDWERGANSPPAWAIVAAEEAAAAAKGSR
jgi:DNA-binding transcriptional regulator YiaG